MSYENAPPQRLDIPAEDFQQNRKQKYKKEEKNQS